MSPWSSDPGKNEQFLSSGTLNQQSSTFDYNKGLSISDVQISISDTQLIRTRSVYNIVDLIADVSGLADILLVFSALLMSTIFTVRIFD